MNFSKVVREMKDLPAWRFLLLWIWLMVFAVSALVHAIRWW